MQRLGFDNARSLARVDYERFFLDHLALIDQVVRGVGRRYRLSPDDVEELKADIHAKLIDHDYEVLRKFQNRCTLRTYLATVVLRHFLDERNSDWGKWRSSVEAKRRGKVAMLLERLTTRDGMPFEQAVTVLQTNHRVTHTVAELREMYEAFPQRTPRHFVGDESLAGEASVLRADDAMTAREAGDQAAWIRSVLAEAMTGLVAQDQILVKMLFRDAMKVSQVARLLKLEQKPLYRRIDSVRRTLREALEAQGVRREDVLALTGRPNVDWEGNSEDET